MERIVGGIFIEAAMPSSCSHSCRQFLTRIRAFAHTHSEKHSPPSVAKISARYTMDKVDLFRVDNGRTRYLSPAEAENLLAACNPDLRVVVLAAMYTGFRKSELKS